MRDGVIDAKKLSHLNAGVVFGVFGRSSESAFGTELSQKLSHELFRAEKMLAKISVSLQEFDFISNFLVVVGGLEPPTPAL